MICNLNFMGIMLIKTIKPKRIYILDRLIDWFVFYFILFSLISTLHPSGWTCNRNHSTIKMKLFIYLNTYMFFVAYRCSFLKWVQLSAYFCNTHEIQKQDVKTALTVKRKTEKTGLCVNCATLRITYRNKNWFVLFLLLWWLEARKFGVSLES